MRLIDADELKNQIEDAVKNQKGSDYDLVKVSELPILIDRQKTAYDVDKVVEQINSIGKSYCDSVKCNKNCGDCDHGCIMSAITERIKAGGIDG